MYTSTQYFNKCCFCASLRTGLLAWSYFKLVFDMIILIFFLVCLFVISYPVGHKFYYFLVQYFMTVTFLLIDVTFHVLLIIGLQKKDAMSLRLYTSYSTTYIIIMSMYFMVSTGFSLKFPSDVDIKTYYDQFVTVVVAIIASVLVLHCYILILINSQKRKLKRIYELKKGYHDEDLELEMKSLEKV